MASMCLRHSRTTLGSRCSAGRIQQHRLTIPAAATSTSVVEVATTQPTIPTIQDTEDNTDIQTVSSSQVSTPVSQKVTGIFQPGVGTARGARRSSGDRPTVAALDAEKFRLDESINKWAGWANRNYDVSSIIQRITAEAAQGGQAASYWAYHLARFSFFCTQAAGVLAAHTLTEAASRASSSSSSAVQGSSQEGGSQVDLKNLPGMRVLNNFSTEFASRLWEGYGSWQQDLEYITRGLYKLPWDMITPPPQRLNPLEVARRSLKFWSEGTATLRRRVRGKAEPVWLQGRIYPQYYQTFHFQTDGWLSQWSADIYEHSTETLFLGRQDAMQRTTLVPISEHITNSSTPLREMKLLEVAAGTGRLHTFIKDNWPEMPTICSDLSPFYLQKARDSMQEWKRLRQPYRSLGGVDGAGVEFMQAAAEKLDMLPDQSVDIVVAVYLFHELPEAVRRKAVAEWFRVLKPGGLCVMADSHQLGDRPEYEQTAPRFGDFNEPYFVNYFQSDLGAMFEDAGFAPQTKIMNSVTKTLSFVKPAPSDN